MNGRINKPILRPLTELSHGEKGEVETLKSGPGFISRMASMGLSPGATVMVMQNFPKRPLIVNVRYTFIALGRSEAELVYISKGTK